MEIITSTENYSACGPINGSIIDDILRVHSVLDLSHEVIDELTCCFNSIYMKLLIGRYRSIKDQIRVYEHLRSCFDAKPEYADYKIRHKLQRGYTYDWSYFELELKGFHHSLKVNDALLVAANAAREDFDNSWCIDQIESDWYVSHATNDWSDVCIVNWVNGYTIYRPQLEDGSFEEPLLNEEWFAGECVHGFMQAVNFLEFNFINTKVTRKDDFRARRSAPMTLGYKILRQGTLDSLFAECYIDADDSPALNPDALAEENRNLREQIELLRAENDRLRAELQDKGEMLHTTDTTAEAEAAPPTPADPAVVTLRPFFNNDDDAKTFVAAVRKSTPTEVTELINNMQLAGTMKSLKKRGQKTKLHKALKKFELYKLTLSNFTGQLK